MFVQFLKTTAAVVTLTAVATSASAADNAESFYKKGTIPLTVNLSGVQIADGPIYISVQKREEYMGMKGHGTIIKTATPGNMTTTVNVAEPGEYAVSVWHDMDDDTIFDMDESYHPSEGFGSSGTPPNDRAPKFNDVKVNIDSYGSSVDVALNYPS